MHNTAARLTLLALLAAGSGTAVAQGLPTSQPKILTIFREEVKPGRNADHARIEAGWPAAYEKARSPDYYLALVSMTGLNEALFVVPSESYTAIGEGMKRDDANAVLRAELRRLARADADVINGFRILQAVARPDLSRGAYPNIAKQRFWELTIFRVRPGHEAGFESAAKAYGSAAERAKGTGYRVYQITAGMPGPTFLVFSTVESYSDFDAVFALDMATMSAMTPEELSGLRKFSTEGLINVETNRYRLDPRMSYVAKETKATDPAFWMAKRSVTTAQPQP